MFPVVSTKTSHTIFNFLFYKNQSLILLTKKKKKKKKKKKTTVLINISPSFLKSYWEVAQLRFNPCPGNLLIFLLSRKKVNPSSSNQPSVIANSYLYLIIHEIQQGSRVICRRSSFLSCHTTWQSKQQVWHFLPQAFTVSFFMLEAFKEDAS